jgi:hypothetical protein
MIEERLAATLPNVWSNLRFGSDRSDRSDRFGLKHFDSVMKSGLDRKTLAFKALTIFNNL